MINLKNFIPAVLGILGITDFEKVAGKDTLTKEQCDKLRSYGFEESFIEDFKKSLGEPEQDGAGAKDNLRTAAVAAALAQVTARHQAVSAELAELKASVERDKASHEAAIRAKDDELASLNDKIAILSATPETDPPALNGKRAEKVVFDLDNTEQLGGMAGEYYSLSRAYNRRARAALLAASGMEVAAVPSHNSVDYKTLQDDLGAFYRTRYSDRLQSFLLELPTITKIFPISAGHQDLETLVNIWLGEFSQPDNSAESDFDKVAKGSYEIGHETLRMYDVMFVHRFKSLKSLEKSWIAYLNKEGSNPLKLSFIEYLLVETAKALHNERELRYVNGVRKDPDPNVPGRAMDAADGIYEFIRKRVDGYTDFTPNGGLTGKTVYQIKPFNLPRITPGNIGEVFYLGTGMVPSVFRDTGKLVLYIPSFMLPWYHKYNEAHYGQNQDYKPGLTTVKEYPNVRIETIPNADNHHRIFWTIDGNFETFERVSGEMLRFTLEQVDWSLKAWSNWGESIQATAVGYKYTRPEDMDGSRQLIWCNDYDFPETFYIEGPKDANPSVRLHSCVVTAANSSVFTITDILDAEVGRIVSIKCGEDGDNGVTIKKEGLFDLISSDWKPAKGEVIRLVKRADGKFVEVSRSTAVSDCYRFQADDTQPSVKGATVFMTGDNTKATAITGLTDAVGGVIYTIHGSGTDYASTIANSGQFVLTDAITLVAGTYIKLIRADDGKFYEVARG